MIHSHAKLSYINNIENTAVLESSIHGYGLYAIKNIPKDTLLCDLSGQIIDEAILIGVMKSKLYDDVLFVEKHHIDNNQIMITPFRTSYSYINHSTDTEHLKEVYKNNVVKVYARINIPKNTEIVSRYNLKKHIV